jgi:hypothetical protein
MLALAAVPAASAVQPNDLTVVFEIDPDHSRVVLDAMKSELTSVMSDAAFGISFKPLRDVRSSDQFVQIVMVRFRGQCRMDGVRARHHWTNTLAFTHSTDGEVLPFAEVSCDRVRDAIHESMWSRRSEHDRLLGRALARVVAHELYHVLANTLRHGSEGIARPQLSADDLLSEDLDFDRADLMKMRSHVSARDSVDGGS